MQDVQDIFRLWPSVSELASQIGEKPDTVLRWKLRGRIPERVWPKVIMAAGLMDKPLTVGQLLAANATPRHAERYEHG